MTGWPAVSYWKQWLFEKPYIKSNILSAASSNICQLIIPAGIASAHKITLANHHEIWQTLVHQKDPYAQSTDFSTHTVLQLIHRALSFPPDKKFSLAQFSEHDLLAS
jgi:hypothetical protein